MTQEKKKPKTERMHQHVVDSCTTTGKPKDICEAQADRVVQRYKDKKKSEATINRWKETQAQHERDTATPASKKNG